jgi:F420-dependent oxidoreductase-like protein
MKLGLSLGYWQGGPPPDMDELVAAAEELGFDSVWTAEAYGSDALTPLAYLAAKTSRLRLGSGIVQMSARTPVATAMAAMTLDHLSGGRFILGLGASGPQVVEGWYGVPFPRPLARTREYVAIVRAVVQREKPVEYVGEHYALPYPGGTGLGKPLKASIHPLRPDLPIFLGAEGPKNVALAGEIADGWLPIFYAPRHDALYRQALEEGFSRRTGCWRREDFEVVGAVTLALDEDVERAADRVRPHLALYIGGMGARGQNFHLNVFARMGYEPVTEVVQELYLSGRKREAAAAIPTELVEEVALIGPPEKVREELSLWRTSLLTTMLVNGPVRQLRALAEMVL